jgi:hypothetical protein
MATSLSNVLIAVPVAVHRYAGTLPVQSNYCGRIGGAKSLAF